MMAALSSNQPQEQHMTFQPTSGAELRALVSNYTPLDEIDVSLVEDFTGLFEGYKGNFHGIEHWDMRNAVTIRNMFRGCSYLTANLAFWQFTGKLTDISGAFEGCGVFNRDLSGWYTGSVKTMARAFCGCANFNNPGVTRWDVSQVEDFGSMFEGCTAFDQDIGMWTTVSGRNFSGFLKDCRSFNRDIGILDLSSAEDLSHMLSGCRSLRCDISGLNVSSARNLEGMLEGCVGLADADLTGWDVSKAESIDRIFYGIESLHFNTKGWRLTSCTSMQDVIGIDRGDGILSGGRRSSVLDADLGFGSWTFSENFLSHYTAMSVTPGSRLLTEAICASVRARNKRLREEQARAREEQARKEAREREKRNAEIAKQARAEKARLETERLEREADEKARAEAEKQARLQAREELRRHQAELREEQNRALLSAS